jgi:hypothetical protein
MRQRKLSVRIVAITAGCATLLGGGVATAAGALPGAASTTATVHTDKAGVSVKGPDAHSAGHADTRGKSATTPKGKPATTPKGKPATTPKGKPATTTEVDQPKAEGPENERPKADEPESDAPGTASKGHGPAVSELARTTTAKGADKGAEISTLASGGKSRAGKQGNDKPEDSGTPDEHAGDHPSQGKPASPGKSGDHHRP